MANNILQPGYYFYDGKKVVLVSDVAFSPSGTAGGDLAGTYPSPQVEDLTITGEVQGSILFFDGGNWIQLAPSTDGYVLNTHSTGNDPTWELAQPQGPAGGDLGGNYPTPTVTDLTIASEEQGSVLYYNGTNWVQLAPGGDGYVLTTHSTGADPTWEQLGGAAAYFVWDPSYAGSSLSISTSFDTIFNAAKDIEVPSTIILDGYTSTTFTLPDQVYDSEGLIDLIVRPYNNNVTLEFPDNCELQNFRSITIDGDVNTSGVLIISSTGAGPNGYHFHNTIPALKFLIKGRHTFVGSRKLIRFSTGSVAAHFTYGGPGNAPISEIVGSEGDLTFEVLPQTSTTANMAKDIGDHGGTLTVINNFNNIVPTSFWTTSWTGTINYNSILNVMDQTAGAILYFDGTENDWTVLDPGPDGYVLTTHGTSAPSWTEPFENTASTYGSVTSSGGTLVHTTNPATSNGNTYTYEVSVEVRKSGILDFYDGIVRLRRSVGVTTIVATDIVRDFSDPDWVVSYLISGSDGLQVTLTNNDSSAGDGAIHVTTSVKVSA